MEKFAGGEYGEPRMIPRSRRPAGGQFVRLALAGVLGLAFLGWLGFRNREPVYQGKTLTNWLYDEDHTVWMPNNVYGHIHNELWEALVSGGYAARERETETAFRGGGDESVDPGVFVTQHLGTNAIPRLLELLSSRPGLR